MNCFGIDFGTTNSCAVNLLSGNASLFGDEEGRPLPSIVVIDKATGLAHCGRDVWRQRLEYAETGGYHVITSIKRIIDKERNWYTQPRKWDVPHVAAAVLQQLSTRAQKKGIRGGIPKATFGIPVGMSPQARRNLRKAAEIAGIKVTGFIKESTAVLMRHWEKVRHCRYVAVFDWGGGTLDISVIEIRGGQLLELHTAGMSMAGDFLDDRIARFIHTKIMEERGSSKSFDEMAPQDRDKLLFRCENAKCELESKSEATIALTQYGNGPLSCALSRDLCRPLIEKPILQSIDLLASCVRDAGISMEELDKVIVVGGSHCCPK